MILDAKGATEVVDYVVSWSALLGADTISTSTFTVSAGLTKDSQSNTTTTATVWVSGGTVNTDYTITNTITTAGGRTWVRTFTVPVRRL